MYYVNLDIKSYRSIVSCRHAQLVDRKPILKCLNNFQIISFNKFTRFYGITHISVNCMVKYEQLQFRDLRYKLQKDIARNGDRG